MPTKVVRKIITIDEEQCNGCGDCALACAEGAIQIIDGKARLISDRYCDGLGACIGECPQGALTIEERESVEFDKTAVEQHLAVQHTQKPLPCGCPSTNVMQFAATPEPANTVKAPQVKSKLTNWPVQLSLVPADAPFLKGADLLLVADCVPFAYAGFHQDFLEGHAVIIACPKLDDYESHQKKLNDIIRKADIKSITVVHMEVPCCSGLVHMAQEALKASGKAIPFKDVTVTIRGGLK
jgi:ferredoxin